MNLEGIMLSEINQIKKSFRDLDCTLLVNYHGLMKPHTHSHTHKCTLMHTHTHTLTRAHTLTHTFPTSPPQAFPAHCESGTNMWHLLVWPRMGDSLCGRLSSKWPLVAPGSFLRARGDPADRVIPNPRFSPPRGLGVLTA